MKQCCMFLNNFPLTFQCMAELYSDKPYLNYATYLEVIKPLEIIIDKIIAIKFQTKNKIIYEDPFSLAQANVGWTPLS